VTAAWAVEVEYALAALAPESMPWWRDLPPTQVDRLIGGGRWRQERELDRAVLVACAMGGSKFDEILGRDFGDSTVPGYRPGDHERRNR